MNKNVEKIIKRNAIKPNYFKNSLIAFICGGFIGVIGQALLELYTNVFNLSNDHASSLMIVTLILVTAILTGFGIYDIFGQFAGAGAFVPITGFANAMTSAALEGKSEGVTLGIGAGMFKLAGSVIALGVTAAYVVGVIRFILFGS